MVLGLVIFNKNRRGIEILLEVDVVQVEIVFVFGGGAYLAGDVDAASVDEVRF